MSSRASAGDWTTAVSTAARTSKVRGPDFVSARDLGRVACQQGVDRGPEGGHVEAAELEQPVARLEPVGERPAAASTTVSTSMPGRSACRAPPGPTRGRRAGSPRSRSTPPRWPCPSERRWRTDLRVGVEAGGEGHRHVRSAQRPLERALEVTAGGEAQPTPLRVADAASARRGRAPAPRGRAVVPVVP